MSGTIVSEWFGPAFGRLHPLLQSLHRHGGKLRGPVEIGFGGGLAGIAGRGIARKLGIPCDGGGHVLEVTIGHDDAVLHWDRRFDDGHCFASTFRPYGRWPDGGWIEGTAAIALRLQVDVLDGGWCWRTAGPLACPALAVAAQRGMQAHRGRTLPLQCEICVAAARRSVALRRIAASRRAVIVTGA